MFRKSEEGLAALEFAAILPVLLAFVFGILQYSIYMFASMAVSAGTESGARVGATGSTGAFGSRDANIRNEITRFTSGLIKPADVTIVHLAYTNFDNIGKPEPCVPVTDPAPCVNGFNDVNLNGQWDADQGRSDAGGSGDVVVYKVTVPIPIFNSLPPAYNFLPNNGTLTAQAAVRNEPF